MKAIRMPSANQKQLTPNLQEQARNWQLAKADGRYRTDQGVPVIRLHKRNLTTIRFLRS